MLGLVLLAWYLLLLLVFLLVLLQSVLPRRRGLTRHAPPPARRGPRVEPMTEEPLRVLWTPEGIILPSGRLCTDVRDIDEPCIIERAKETGEHVSVTFTQADCDAAAAKVRQQSVPHTCTRWCAPPQHAELHTYGAGTPACDVRMTEQRAARALGRTVERVVPVQTTDRTPTVLTLVFFHEGEP